MGTPCIARDMVKFSIMGSRYFLTAAAALSIFLLTLSPGSASAAGDELVQPFSHGNTSGIYLRIAPTTVAYFALRDSYGNISGIYGKYLKSGAYYAAPLHADGNDRSVVFTVDRQQWYLRFLPMSEEAVLSVGSQRLFYKFRKAKMSDVQSALRKMRQRRL